MCNHVWCEVHERSLIGTHFPSHWKCEVCGRIVTCAEMTPAGLGGTISSKVDLMSPHGAHLEQTYDRETKQLTKHHA